METLEADGRADCRALAGVERPRRLELGERRADGTLVVELPALVEASLRLALPVLCALADRRRRLGERDPPREEHWNDEHFQRCGPASTHRGTLSRRSSHLPG